MLSTNDMKLIYTKSIFNVGLIIVGNGIEIVGHEVCRKLPQHSNLLQYCQNLNWLRN